MKTCLVLGAGFSKSVAGLPVTQEMINKFKSIIEEQEALGHRNRVGWGNQIMEFINSLENEFLIKPYARASKGGKILKSNYSENFEAICSLIDLNISFEVDARSESNGETSDLSGKPLFINYTTPELRALRSYIGTYLYLSLINYSANQSYLELFNSHFSTGISSIVSFNYDLVLEKYLFEKKRWYPKDGYGFEISNLPKINPDFQNVKSDFEILKLHGSLNWEVDKIFHPIVELEWCDDNTHYFFPGYLLEEKKRGFIYQGGVSSGGWLLPSWIKQFEYDELIQVWRKASIALNDADQIYFIGYSLPRADTSVYAMFTGIDFSQKKVVVIDPNTDELMENYSRIICNSNIEFVKLKLEDYLLKYSQGK